MLRVACVLAAAFLAAAAERSPWLDVPFVRQEKNGCGAACLTMLIRYWKAHGARELPDPDPAAIQKALYRPEARGILGSDMERYLKDTGFRVFVFRAEWSDLSSHLEKGRALIVCLGPNDRGPFHYVVLAGVDPSQNLVLVNDPARRKLTKLDRRTFEKDWAASGNWTLLAVPANLPTPHDPEASFQRGMEFARAGQWQEASAEFESGARANPRDKRFPIELSGVAFKLNDFGSAKHYLRIALALDPRDRYANDFLGTLFLLDGNVDAALKYWNRIEKPRVEDVRTDPQPRVDPVLLDRALLFSPAATLELRDYLASRARIDLLGIFPRYRFELDPEESSTFTLLFRASERDGLGGSTAERLAPLLRGLAFQTIYPAYFNLRRRAINLESMVRWDAQKQRILLSLSGPLTGDPRLRGRLYVDGRRENWDLTHTFHDSASAVKDFGLRRFAAGAEMRAVASDRWQWWTGLEVSWRGLPDRERFGLTSNPVFVPGFAPAVRAGTSYALLRLPERRLSINGVSTIEIGKVLSSRLGPFTRLQGSLEGRWLPQARGDDYAMKGGLHAGKLFGDAPFDELFMLGLERDNDLWLHGHVGTADGRKGSAPLGRQFVLVNWEMDKIIHRGAFWTLLAGPLLDSGRITDGRSGFGSPKWLTDVGAQCKVRVLSDVTLAFSWGKDLRAGRNAFYATLVR